MNSLGLRSYGEYYARVMADKSGQELEILINAVTTNKTDFFRESHHFRYLQEVVFPRIRARAQGGTPRLRIWSAGCSTGEEPYSIAMTIADAMGHGPRWDVRIVATDLDTQVLQKAQHGVYARERLDPVPADLVKRYMHKTSNPNELAAAPELKAMLQFQQLNFVADTWPVQGPFDAIFFRNVAIYFDRPTQDRILRRMVALLDPTGDLIVGHSESLHWLADLVVPVANTVYRQKGSVGPTPTRPRSDGPIVAQSSPPPPGLGMSPAAQPSSASLRPRPAVPAVPPMPSAPRPPVTAGPSAKPTPPPPPPAKHAHPYRHAHTPHLSVPPLPPRTAAGAPAPRPAPHAPSHAHEPGGLPAKVITVGGVFASREPSVVKTLLGSCIAACLWDPVAKVGGMNHFLLPDGGASEIGSSRFGVHAMELLINEIMKCGGDRRRLEAKVFGAGHVLRVAGFDSAVPRRNATFIRDFLKKEHIKITAERLLGDSPLEVKFSTSDGRAWVRALEANATKDVAAAEARFVAEARKTEAAPPSPDVELF